MKEPSWMVGLLWSAFVIVGMCACYILGFVQGRVVIRAELETKRLKQEQLQIERSDL